MLIIILNEQRNTMSTQTTRDRLRRIVDLLDEVKSEEALNLLLNLTGSEEVEAIPPILATERSGVRISRKEVVKPGRPTAADDPLWGLVGLVGDEYQGPTDVAANPDKYLTEIYGDLHDE
jgi:hypothetical protein